MVVTAFSLIDEDPTLSGEEGLTGAEVERILARLEQLSDQIAEIGNAVSVLQAGKIEQEARVSLFWAKDWPALLGEIAEHKARSLELERRLDATEKVAIEQKTLAAEVSKKVEEHEKLKNKVLAWAAALGAGGAGLVELLSRALK